jgi:hypothetical protein
VFDSGNIDTSYTKKKYFSGITISAGTCTLTSSGANETFYGTGVLSSTLKDTYYHAQDSAGANVNLSATSPAAATVTVAGNGQSVTIFTGDNSLNTTFNFWVTMNVDTKQERIKTLVLNKELAIASPSSTALGYTSLNLADATLIKAIYDSGNTGTDAVAPTLTVSGATGTFIAGETITGGTSGAKGTVIAHTPLTTITFVVSVPAKVPDVTTNVIVVNGVCAITVPFAPDVPPVIVSPAIKVPVAPDTVNVGATASVPVASES